MLRGMETGMAKLKFEQEDGTWVVSHPTIEECGIGDTRDEAEADFWASLRELVYMLDATPEVDRHELINARRVLLEHDMLE